jgi:predicted RNA-binding Zn-ribbon protein involved in translation (DUF1610 family)
MADLEERSIESLPERCQSCGTALTDAEKRRILDDGAATALCTTCAAEVAPVAEEPGLEDAEGDY